MIGLLVARSMNSIGLLFIPKQVSDFSDYMGGTTRCVAALFVKLILGSSVFFYQCQAGCEEIAEKRDGEGNKMMKWTDRTRP